MGPIPANSVLIFETELVGIAGVDKEELWSWRYRKGVGTWPDPAKPARLQGQANNEGLMGLKVSILQTKIGALADSPR
jgi:hypothetical protein